MKLLIYKRTNKFFISVLLILFSCNSSRLEYDYIHIKSYSSNKTMSLMEIAKKVNIIPLENKKNELFYHIRKMEIDSAGNFYILSKMPPMIHKFSSTGGNMSSLNGLGKGNGEYLQIADFILDKNSIKIMDDLSRKIIIYSNTDSFNIENEVFLNFHARKFVQHKNKYYFYIPNLTTTNYSIVKYNSNFVLEGCSFLVERNKKHLTSILPNNFSIYNDTLLFNKPFDNNIYNLLSEGSKVRYSIDFDKYNIPSSLFDKKYGFKQFFDFLQNSEYAHSIMFFSESHNYIFFQYVQFKKKHFVFIDKKTNEISIFNNFKSDFENLLFKRLIKSEDDKLYFEIEYYELYDKLKNKKYTNYDTIYTEKIFQHNNGIIQKDGNPFIAVVTLN